jgi:hypothetical protein
MRPDDVALYIRSAAVHGLLDDEIESVRRCLLYVTKNPDPNPEYQRQKVSNFTFLFRALLSEKSRQKPVENVRQHDSRPAQDCSTRPAHDPTRRKSIWHILKQKIAGCG